MENRQEDDTFPQNGKTLTHGHPGGGNGALLHPPCCRINQSLRLQADPTARLLAISLHQLQDGCALGSRRLPLLQGVHLKAHTRARRPKGACVPTKWRGKAWPTWANSGKQPVAPKNLLERARKPNKAPKTTAPRAPTSHFQRPPRRRAPRLAPGAHRLLEGHGEEVPLVQVQLRASRRREPRKLPLRDPRKAGCPLEIRTDSLSFEGFSE